MNGWCDIVHCDEEARWRYKAGTVHEWELCDAHVKGDARTPEAVPIPKEPNPQPAKRHPCHEQLCDMPDPHECSDPKCYPVLAKVGNSALPKTRKPRK